MRDALGLIACHNKSGNFTLGISSYFLSLTYFKNEMYHLLIKSLSTDSKMFSLKSDSIKSHLQYCFVLFSLSMGTWIVYV